MALFRIKNHQNKQPLHTKKSARRWSISISSSSSSSTIAVVPVWSLRRESPRTVIALPLRPRSWCLWLRVISVPFCSIFYALGFLHTQTHWITSLSYAFRLQTLSIQKCARAFFASWNEEFMTRAKRFNRFTFYCETDFNAATYMTRPEGTGSRVVPSYLR